MVNRHVALVIALLWGGMVLASDDPAEQPPPDFPSKQYIDSKGCVFRLDGTGRWTPRMDSDDLPVCGYPPTLSARRLSPDAAPQLFSPSHPEPARAIQIEEALAGLVIPNLQTGELVGDRAAFQPRPDMGPEPSSAAPLHDLRAEIASQGQVRAQMNGILQPNRSLCRLLGLDEQKSDGAQIMPGADPTQGFCDNIPRDDLARLAFIRPANLPVPAGPDTSASARSQTQLAAVVPARPVARDRKQGSGAAKVPAPAGSRNAPTPAPTSQAGGAMTQKPTTPPDAAVHAGKTQPEGPWIIGIPAGTRFILVGTYQNGPEVDDILRRLSRMNMPIVRQISPVPARGSTQVILVGPFESRQSIVRAFDRLRRAGLPASPR